MNPFLRRHGECGFTALCFLCLFVATRPAVLDSVAFVVLVDGRAATTFGAEIKFKSLPFFTTERFLSAFGVGRGFNREGT